MSVEVKTTRARYSRLTWWTIPVSGGTTRKFRKAVLAPAKERVPLLVPGELELGIGDERDRRPCLVHLNRVVDHQLDRLERVDPRRVAAHRLHRVAHGGEVDDGGDAREVLQEHAARSEGDLAAGDRLGVPLGQARDVVGRDGRPILVAEQVFQEDLQRVGQPTQVDPVVGQHAEAVIAEGAVVHFEGREGVVTVGHGGTFGKLLPWGRGPSSRRVEREDYNPRLGPSVPAALGSRRVGCTSRFLARATALVPPLRGPFRWLGSPGAVRDRGIGARLGRRRRGITDRSQFSASSWCVKFCIRFFGSGFGEGNVSAA